MPVPSHLLWLLVSLQNRMNRSRSVWVALSASSATQLRHELKPTVLYRNIYSWVAGSSPPFSFVGARIVNCGKGYTGMRLYQRSKERDGPRGSMTTLSSSNHKLHVDTQLRKSLPGSQNGHVHLSTRFSGRKTVPMPPD